MQGVAVCQKSAVAGVKAFGSGAIGGGGRITAGSDQREDAHQQADGDAARHRAAGETPQLVPARERGHEAVGLEFLALGHRAMHPDGELVVLHGSICRHNPAFAEMTEY